jgi:hypothetical protein
VQQWSMGVQRELAHFMVVKANYVGTKGNYLQRIRFVNPLVDARLVPATSVADETARLAAYNAAIAAGNGNATTYSNRFDPRFNSVTYLESSANSNYHAFEFLAVKQFSRGYHFQVAYTRSKSIDDISDALGVLINDSSAQQDPKNNRNGRAVSQFDLANRVVVSHVWELPFGKGISNPLLRRMAAGWTFAGISSWRSGFPVRFSTGSRRGVQNPSLIGQAADIVRPNTSGPFQFNPRPAGSAGTPNGLNNDPVARISAYADSLGLSQPLLGSIGNLGRNVTRLNPETNFDWNFAKKTAITERVNLELRAEFYNVFNLHAFQDATRIISSPTFGQYTTVATGARLIQVGARLAF